MVVNMNGKNLLRFSFFAVTLMGLLFNVQTVRLLIRYQELRAALGWVRKYVSR